MHRTSPKWICAQIGAREHYAIPRALHRHRHLAGLYTDFWAGSLTKSLLPAGGAFGSLAQRCHPDLVHVPVTSCNFRSLTWEARLRRQPQEGGGRYLGFCEVGQRFARWVCGKLKHRDVPAETIYFSYDTGALETFAWLRDRNIRCVLGQMDPGRTEVELVREEEKLWPGWSLRSVEVPEDYCRRREQEWNLANRIVVNSEFSRQALIRQGVPPEKLMIIPLSYEEGEQTEVVAPARETALNPLRVLFLGQVILRKGIQYLIEAAKMLQDEPVRFDVVGAVGLSEQSVRSAPANLTFHGPVTRHEAREWYRRSHLFVLPTVSDGFALTQIEAMSHGLPVIATPNCGDVVTDGQDGFLVPVRDAAALARAVLQYAGDRDMLRSHQAGARHKAVQFSLSRLSERLASLRTE